LAEALNVLVKNIQEINEGTLDKMEEVSVDPAADKNSMESVFKDSLIGKIFFEAQNLMKESSYRNFVKIHIHPDIRMAKLEISIGTLNMKSTAVNNLEMTYDTTLNVTFLYNPDVILLLPLVLCDL